MKQKTVRVKNKLGLHARPSALVVKAATKYRSDFFI
ncbi:MAG: HPr family phosphocarrier protein, partial [Candidatus Cloacimonadaceae bacterium]